LHAKLITIAVVGFLAMTSGVASAAQGDAASGAGTFDDWPHCASGSTTTFEFTAAGTGTGATATGTFSFVCSSPQVAFSGVVSCLEVDGGEASIGGTVTTSTSVAVPAGTQLTFDVVDGGPAGAGDQIGFLYTGATCRNNHGGMLPLTSGDILVQDGTLLPSAQCADGLDNDGDGTTDFPADAGCTSAEDDTESPNPPPPTPAGPASKEDCMKGGYAQYGFKNQGACIKAVHSI
jgi:hypothetical protein